MADEQKQSAGERAHDCRACNNTGVRVTDLNYEVRCPACGGTSARLKRPEPGWLYRSVAAARAQAPSPDREKLREQVARLLLAPEQRSLLRDIADADPAHAIIAADKLAALLSAQGEAVAWRAMADAPHDGSEIEALCVHKNALYSTDAWGEGWVAIVRAKWIDHHGGGWTWNGLAGVFVAWRPTTTPAPAGWRDMESAPVDTPVIIRTAGGAVLLARLRPAASVDSDEKVCDQWQAEIADVCPPCWSDGCCWASNEDEEPSDQPVAWMPCEALNAADRGEG